LLQVTAFAGNQILVRNVGLLDPRNPVQTVTIEIPPQNAPTATLTTIAPARPALMSPPREVFVAASVRFVTPAPIPTPAATAPPAAAATAAPVADVEARIVAVRAAGAEMAAAAPRTVSVPQVLVRAPVATAIPLRLAPRTAQTPQTSHTPQASQSQKTPEALLASLQVPKTALTVAAARMASSAVATLPKVLARLDALLPRITTDPRIGTLRTLLPFVSRLDPTRPSTFSQQISAYASNVVEGAEPKLAALLTAHADGALQSRPHETSDNVHSAAPLPVVAQAKAAERAVALDHDLKTLVLSLIGRPPAQSPPAFALALTDALTALTGVQLTALAANAQTPNVITLALPLFSYPNGQPAQLRIDRDAPGRRERLDADNFHVAFVLDTATLGTVAIDVETVGRQVKLNVKTERQPAADRFASSLSTLRARLEHLRYRVSSMHAEVAAKTPSNAPASATRPAIAEPATSRLDVQA
ncbi:MAG TPA: flagellar hook-length control protein FliK, partial [Candidatus Baltobacteraceae bacterium]